MYTNKKDAELREKERLFPGYIEKMEKINRIKSKLDLIAHNQSKRVQNASKKGEKISFWTHTKPTKIGYYDVEYQERSIYDFDDILFYNGVESEWQDYNDKHVHPKLLKKTAYWDGVRYDVKNVRYYLFEMK